MNESRATDERPPYFSIEESVVDLFDLNPLAGWLYVVIVRHINRKKNDAFPSVTTLAKIAKMSKASVLRYTQELEDKHLIEVTRETDKETKEKSVNHYKLLSAHRVVSDSNQGGDYEKRGVVSDSNINQKNINQKNITNKEQEIPAPTTGAVAAQSVEPERETETTVVEEKQTESEIKSGSHSPVRSESSKGARQQAAGARPKREPTEWQQIVGLFKDFLHVESGTATRFGQLVTGTAKSGIWADSKLEQATNLRELKGWRRWIEQTHQRTPVTAPWVQESFAAFRRSQAYEDAIADANAPPPEPVVAEPAPPPEVAARRAQDYHAAIAQMAALKTLTPEWKPNVAA